MLNIYLPVFTLLALHMTGKLLRSSRYCFPSLDVTLGCQSVIQQKKYVGSEGINGEMDAVSNEVFLQ